MESSTNSFSDDKVKSTDLFGQSMVSILDYWAQYCIDLIENPQPSVPYVRDNVLSRRDSYFRSAFASLDKELKEVVTELICKATSGIMFSTLVNFDQYDHGELKILHISKDREESTVEITQQDSDLHDQLVGWIDKYSEKKELFIQEEEYKGRKSIGFR